MVALRRLDRRLYLFEVSGMILSKLFEHFYDHGPAIKLSHHLHSQMVVNERLGDRRGAP